MSDYEDHQIAGLTIGQTFEGGDHDMLRIVVIDPETHVVEAEDTAGALVVDDIDHFRATHRTTDWPLAG